jgi:hypothetical protein
VLAFCNHKARFGRSILLTPTPPRIDPSSEVIQIPNLDTYGVAVFITGTIGLISGSPFVMQIHNDGFILDVDLWDQRFLDYDYIGAPWADGLVGNQGFCIQSQRCLRAINKLTFLPPEINSDMWFCHHKRAEMEAMGVTFAPTELAEKFSTELTCQGAPSFGYHGKACQPEKHCAGWEQITNWESTR